MPRKLFLAAAVIVCAALQYIPVRAAARTVEMTWMSISSWYFRIGDTRIVMDGYVSRVPQSLFLSPPEYPKDVYGYTREAYGIDIPSIERVRNAMLAGSKLNYLIVGHSHFDHSWDTPTWAKLTRATMIGGTSTCFQARAQNVSKDQCRIAKGGEKLELGDGVSLRVVRFNHSGDASNPIQHFARELYRPPVPDSSTGGFRAGVGEDYPNGGGSLGFLFTVDATPGQLAFFVQSSASAFDFDKDIIVDGVNYGSPSHNLTAALADAGLKSVDVWIGTGGVDVAKRIVPILHPKVYLPNHWDGPFNSLWKGMPMPFRDDALKAYLDEQRIILKPEHQYFDTYLLSAQGVSEQPNHVVKQKLGLQDVQPF
jgi:L-ascorbate metabolism protein UlaG (beta-lactamase superfamily)